MFCAFHLALLLALGPEFLNLPKPLPYPYSSALGTAPQLRRHLSQFKAHRLLLFAPKIPYLSLPVGSYFCMQSSSLFWSNHLGSGCLPPS